MDIHRKSRMRTLIVPQIVDRTFVDTWVSGLHVATDSERTFVAQVTHAWTFVAQLSSLVDLEQSRRVVQYG